MKDSIEFMSSHETPFYAWLGRYLIIVIDDPDDAYTILTSKSCMEKSATYKFFNRIGLLTAPGRFLHWIEMYVEVATMKVGVFLVHIWKPMRKLLNSAFNIRILQSFFPVFNEKVTYLIRNIDRQVGEGTFDILKLLHSCTLDMVCCKFTKLTCWCRWCCVNFVKSKTMHQLDRKSIVLSLLQQQHSVST